MDPTPITYDWDAGRVYGHIALWPTCHVGIRGECVTPPMETDEAALSWFNRYLTADGQWAGRLTVGGGHASTAHDSSIMSAIAEHDAKTVAAIVRATNDESGIWVEGVIAPGLSPEEMATLNRRRVSGDWRMTEPGFRLVELLALEDGPVETSEPGFPVVTEWELDGRTLAVTASLGSMLIDMAETEQDVTGPEVIAEIAPEATPIAPAVDVEVLRGVVAEEVGRAVTAELARIDAEREAQRVADAETAEQAAARDGLAADLREAARRELLTQVGED